MMVFPHISAQIAKGTQDIMAFESRRSSETLAAWPPVSISRLTTATVMKDLEIGDSPQKVTERNAKAKETFS